MDTFRVGDAEVTRVVEWVGPIVDGALLFPDTPADVLSGDAPTFYDGGSGRYRGAIQTWVIRTEGLTVVVDTGVGNGRTRPQVPAFDHLDTDFPERLAADVEYFAPENTARMRPPTTEDQARRVEGIRHVYADSITPVMGQVETWSGAYDLTDRLRLEAAPGHTPGSSVVWFRDGAGAVCGDLVNAPAAGGSVRV